MSKRTLSESAEDWIEYAQPNPAAPLRLFCFPFAGGSATIYRYWHGGPLRDVEVCPVQLPGRERRLSEAPFLNISSLVRQLVETLPRERPFALFGHSMGALIAFEFARELRRRGEFLPLHLFVSGAAAAHLGPTRPLRFRLNRADLIMELRKLGGTPEEVLQNDELLDMILPAIRADFSLIDTYEYTAELPLDCPITALGSTADAEVDEFEVMSWRTQTASQFQYARFEGDHFFLMKEMAAVRAAIAARCLPD